jgi:hypothetical protein
LSMRKRVRGEEEKDGTYRFCFVSAQTRVGWSPRVEAPGDVGVVVVLRA